MGTELNEDRIIRIMARAMWKRIIDQGLEDESDPEFNAEAALEALRDAGYTITLDRGESNLTTSLSAS